MVDYSRPRGRAAGIGRYLVVLRVPSGFRLLPRFVPACLPAHRFLASLLPAVGAWLVQDKRIAMVVTTEMAARGLDVAHLTHVVNYDLPTDADHYVHRAGR